MLKHLIFVSFISIVICAPNGRVVGGSDANIVDFPYQIAIQFTLGDSEFFVCGGSILNRNTILTAAHCVDWGVGNTFSVRAGSALHASGGQIVDVTEIHLHPLWNFTAMDFDVAILKIEDLEFNDEIQPIGLPQPHDDVPTGTTVTLTGWGLMSSDDGDIPDILQVANKPVVDRAECIAMLDEIEIENHEPVISERNICAGEMGVGACNGDSGGPLVWNNAVVGIVSWGQHPCGFSGFPTIYMRTSYFMDFIGEYL